MSRLFRQLLWNKTKRKIEFARCVQHNSYLLSAHSSHSLAEANLKIQEIFERPEQEDASLMPPTSASQSATHRNKLGIMQRMQAASSAQQVNDLLLEYETELLRLRKKQYCDRLQYPPMHRVYPAAIKRCAKLNEQAEGWKLFETCKQREILSPYLYSVMMWYTMYFDASTEALNKSFSLFYEMLNETTFIPTAMVDAALIDNCRLAQQYERGFDVLQKIKASKNATVLLRSQTLLRSVAALYVESGQIDAGLPYLFKLYQTLKIIPNGKQCQLLLSGIANNIAMTTNFDERQRYLFYAQKLFDFAFNKNKGHSPLIQLYGPYMNIFAKIGDYQTCIEFIHCMMKNEKYPNPNIVCCSTALSALIHFNNYNYERMDVQAQQQAIEQVMRVVNELQLAMDKKFYYIVMNICMQHADIDELLMYYKQFTQDDSIELKTEYDVMEMAEFAVKCFQNMQNEEPDEDETEPELTVKISEFKAFAVEEYKRYNTKPMLEQEKDIAEFANTIDKAL